MLIAGTRRDGQFATVAEELAADHLDITYDGRGTTRSAGPSCWSETTVMEQADDAAAVLSLVGQEWRTL